MCRHCLWILGNGATLSNSDSIWKKLIIDAKNRDCFYNADEDDELSQAIASALVDLGPIQFFLNSDSLLFRNAKWKVHSSTLIFNFHHSTVLYSSFLFFFCIFLGVIVIPSCRFASTMNFTTP